MRFSALLLLYFLAGCTQLLNGYEQPVKQIGKDDLFHTTCSGLAEAMVTCFDKANRTCAGNYAIIKQIQDSNGVHRELTFQCKK